MTISLRRPEPGYPSASESPSRQTTYASLLALSRPGQWPKNTLVAAAPFAAGALDQTTVTIRTAGMALAFLAASIATYAANDLADVEADRAHPRKQFRPLASAAVSPLAGKAWGAGAAVIAIGVAAALGPLALLVISVYLGLTHTYSRWLKRLAVLEIIIVAAGFVLRAIGGAVATGLPVSNWFLLVCLFGSLYLVVAKRAAESNRARGTGVHAARAVLSEYPATWLDQMMTISLTGTVMAYALWAVQDVGTDVFAPVLAATVVPFLMLLMRYALLVSRGSGETPESDALHDRCMVVTGLVWLVMCGVGLYLA
jgi:decaprenyl-phosphate phosphoribosyltransferase